MSRRNLAPRWALALAFALAAAVVFAASARTTALTPRMPIALDDDESAATTDDARAMLFNPAALGLRYPAELYEGFARHDPYHEWNTTLGTWRGMGLLALRQRDTSQTYGMSFAFGSPRLRFGFSPYWLTAGKPVHDLAADHRVGVLSRPAPWVSMGFAVDHLFQPIFRRERRARLYDIGLGLRPLAGVHALAHDWGTRLTLSGDVILVDDGDWRQARVRVAGEFEALPGLSLRATVADHRNVRVGLTLRGASWAVHGGEAREAGRLRYQNYAVAVHAGEEPSGFAAASARRVAVVRAGGLLADESLGGVSLTGATGTVSAKPLHGQLQRALEDPLTRGVLLELNGVGGMAQLEELRPRLAALRAAGKPVVAYMENGGGRGDLYLAGACDRVVASEEAQFMGLGLRTERRYWRSALARAGVRIERTSTGQYKNAYRNFSTDSMPPADSVVVLRDLLERQRLFVSTLGADRKLAPDVLERYLDGRDWSSADLAGAGVIDSVGYREDALRMLGALAGLGEQPRTVSLALTRPARREWMRPTRLAVVYAGGGMDLGRSGNDVLTGPFMGSETVIAELERAFHEPGVRAVVLRIESPGGSALACNLIDHAIVKLKRETHRPLVVSMGSLAGSAAYYIACHADWIVCDHHTRTGSIGVLDLRPSFEGLYKKLGVNQAEFDLGDYMSGTSWSRDWTAREQAAADSTIARLYRGFVSKVADGRKMSFGAVDAVAQGRVWMGDDALANKLVDQIGTFEDALAEARRRGHVDPDERIRLLELGRPRGSFLQRLVGGWMRETLAREARLPEPGARMEMDDTGGIAPLAD